ncbi:MAG: hypothetical protein K9N34_03025 [Candidatus Marinimicrobia bacterium]|nr:hypothetical protein [Candidatus Neomarinimicrobiota bacterium]MCF7839494.1 hypothetical protein [Candidatus Neomarinimicrobiota bacterium]
MANFSQRFAEIISVLLHPFLMAGFIWIYIPLQTELAGWPLWRAGIIGWLFCIVLPLVYLFVQKQRGKIDDLDIRQRERRNRHFAVFKALYTTQLFIFILLQSPDYVLALAFAYAFNTLVYAFINRFWKISIHGAGVGGPVGALLYLSQGAQWWLLLLFPFLAWSRVKLKHHTPAQTVAGLGLGLLLVYLEFYLTSFF